MQSSGYPVPRREFLKYATTFVGATTVAIVLTTDAKSDGDESTRSFFSGQENPSYGYDP